MIQRAPLRIRSILGILLTAGEPLESARRSVVEHGFEVLEATLVKDDIYKVIVKS